MTCIEAATRILPLALILASCRGGETATEGQSTATGDASAPSSEWQTRTVAGLTISLPEPLVEKAVTLSGKDAAMLEGNLESVQLFDGQAGPVSVTLSRSEFATTDGLDLRGVATGYAEGVEQMGTFTNFAPGFSEVTVDGAPAIRTSATMQSSGTPARLEALTFNRDLVVWQLTTIFADSPEAQGTSEQILSSTGIADQP